MAANAGRLYQWAIQRTESNRAPIWIGLIFFLELVLVIPLDAILVFFCLQKRQWIFLYVMIASVASTFSGYVDIYWVIFSGISLDRMLCRI